MPKGLELPAEPVWLRQVHGARTVDAARFPQPPGGARPRADAAWTDRPGVVCAVLTADCLPVLLCERSGNRVCAVHAGWRGLAEGVLQSAVRAMGGRGEALLAWLGPAIGPDRYEVGPEVRERMLAGGSAPEAAFRPSGRRDHWLCDLYGAARHQLAGLAVTEVHGGGFCTYSEPDRFFSYRRDGRTGRMATVIWIEE